MSDEETLASYTGAFVDELVRSGVTDVVICPGSRSTPLAMMMAKHPDMKVWMHIDERSAGYFALGMAKAHRAPIALLCSSGTAAANFFPAVVEAHEARVPLLVLTADRPHELRDVGAPQAIDQMKLYGGYAKWFMEMALPESTPDMLRYVRTVAGRAAATAFAAPSGPVHLNFPFRDPLVPKTLTDPWPCGRADGQSYITASQGSRLPDSARVEKLAAELKTIERGLIVCGPQEDPGLPEALVRLARRLHYPILADPLSGLRNGSHGKTRVLDGYDAFLRDEQVTDSYVPGVILRFGAMPVSKAFLLYVKKHPGCRQIVVDDGGWREPTQLASDIVMADPAAFCNMLVANIGNHADRQGLIKETGGLPTPNPRKEGDLSSEENHKSGAWEKAWIDLNTATQQQVAKYGMDDALSEGRVFQELADGCLPSGATLFVGSSMPVRDLDTFFMNNELEIRTMANRGANGIDGVISTALGASTEEAPLVLVIGDLSFYHDLNGLLAAKLHHLNLTIIVINNNGGGIFSFLPQANSPEHFEQLFGTPTDLDFGKVVEMYGGSFYLANKWEDFRQEVRNGMESGGLSVIEIKTDRGQNTDRHRSMWECVSEAVKNLSLTIDDR